MEASSPSPVAAVGVIEELDRLVQNRVGGDAESSYTASLLASEVHRVAQKVGEEAVEVILAATSRDDDGLIDEAADLIYHLLVLLRKRGLSWHDVTDRLRSRRDGASS